MAMLGTVLMVIGALGSLIFSIQILISAFKTSIVWGLLSLFIAPVMLVYVFTHWAETKTPFLRWLACFVLCVIAGGISMYGAFSGMPAH